MGDARSSKQNSPVTPMRMHANKKRIVRYKPGGISDCNDDLATSSVMKPQPYLGLGKRYRRGTCRCHMPPPPSQLTPPQQCLPDRHGIAWNNIEIAVDEMEHYRDVLQHKCVCPYVLTSAVSPVSPDLGGQANSVLLPTQPPASIPGD